MIKKRMVTGLLAGFFLLVWSSAVAADVAAPGVDPIDPDGLERVVYPALPLTFDDEAYLSEIITAPARFNALVPAWNPADDLELEIRTGRDGAWSPWSTVNHNHDLTLPGEALEYGDMFFVSAADGTHRQVQLRTFAKRDALPTLHLTFIDTSEGPTTKELLAQQAALDAAQTEPAGVGDALANPKPSVISRGVWCTYAECSFNSCMDTDPLKWAPVTHLIVHHTVSSNSNANWAAVVRAIFRFHALETGRCWGDIGYNYLIDMNGVIYEGHRGGDNVIGTHAAGGNKGSMGVSLIGTFTWESEYAGGIRPPDPMLNSLLNILAWKADQRGINVFEGSVMPDLGSARPHLMGHRDIYGTTTCPGGQAHALLPWVRDQVAARLPWLVNDHLYIDELGAQFSKFTSLRWSAPRQCGFNAHAYYTWSTNDQNATPYWGEWRFNVPENGLYEVEVFVPYCNTGQDETGSARYTIYHSGGSSQVTLNQEARVGRWSSLGSFPIALASDNRLRLTDITQDSGLGVWYDTIRLRRLQNYGRVDLRAPSPDAWVASMAVTFRWDVIDVVNPASMRLRVATDPGMTNIIKDVILSAGARESTQSFSGVPSTLYWQVTAVGWTTANSPVGTVKIDTVAPTISLVQVFKLPWGSYLFDVAAADGESGLASISAQYRQVGHTVWTNLISGTTHPGLTLIPPDPSKQYEIRLSAQDAAGNVKNYSSTPDGSTVGAKVLTRTFYFAVNTK